MEENKILRLRLNVREGWVNKETGRVGDPRIQFLNIELLDGIINSNSKKITLKVDSKSINNDDIHMFSCHPIQIFLDQDLHRIYT